MVHAFLTKDKSVDWGGRFEVVTHLEVYLLSTEIAGSVSVRGCRENHGAGWLTKLNSHYCWRGGGREEVMHFTIGRVAFCLITPA